MKKDKILFILKRKETYGAMNFDEPKGLSTGLYNSASFVVDMLKDSGINAVVEVAIDNNCIDRLVTKHKPTHVIIEALWVVPSKFEILQKLHPEVEWIVRLHSEMPFIAGEGNAMKWIGEYITYENVYVSCNAPRILDEIRNYIRIKFDIDAKTAESWVLYQPNFYPQEYKTKKFKSNKEYIDISCFGAIRPLKNQLVQAHAAIRLADVLGKKLRFHINSSRVEMNGNAVLTNLIGIFAGLEGSGHELVHHEWTVREEFLELCATMDIGMQVSFSETFNIVGCDLISQGVPIISSKEIPWSSFLFDANPTSTKDIYNTLLNAYLFPSLNVKLNQIGLSNYTNKTRKIWKKLYR